MSVPFNGCTYHPVVFFFSAVRHRERRLKSFWRHAQYSIKTALAGAAHHSWNSRPSVGAQADVLGRSGLSGTPCSRGSKLVEVLKVYLQDRLQQRFLEQNRHHNQQGSVSRQSATASWSSSSRAGCGGRGDGRAVVGEEL